MNGCRVGSRGARHAFRIVLDRDDVGASDRSVEHHGHRLGRGVLRDRRAHTVTVGAKDIAPTRKVEQGVEVAGRDRLRDREAVVAGRRRDRHPVEEHTGGDIIFDCPTTNAVVQSGQRIGGTVDELVTSRARGSDLAQLTHWRWCRCWCWR